MGLMPESGIGQGILAVVLILLVVSGLGATYMWATQGSGLDDGSSADQKQDDKNKEPASAPWEGRSVKVDVEYRNQSSDTIQAGTLHVYENKPEEWENHQTISNTYGSNDEFTQYSIDSSGTTTIQETPGTYYIAVEPGNGNYYTEFQKLEIPDGSDISDTLNEYNQAPNLVKTEITNRYSLGSSSWDVGVSSNGTSSTEFTDRNTYNPNRNEEYWLQKVVVQPGDQDSSSNSDDPTDDSNSDGTYDMAISESYVEVTGAVSDGSENHVYFKPGNGIDELGSTNKAEIFVDESGDEMMRFTRDDPMTVEVGITSTDFEDSGHSISTDDEKFTNGENAWDINFCDVAGNCNTVKGVTG